MRSVIDVSQFASSSAKFNSGKGDKTFTIFHGAIEYLVDIYGNVITPFGIPLEYSHLDMMMGMQSNYLARVKDFLTVDPSMDNPASKLW